jgi:uncharacterized membrane protein
MKQNSKSYLNQLLQEFIEGYVKLTARLFTTAIVCVPGVFVGMFLTMSLIDLLQRYYSISITAFVLIFCSLILSISVLIGFLSLKLLKKIKFWQKLEEMAWN